MTRQTTKQTDIQHDIQTYMAKKLLSHAKYQTVLHQFGKREDIPAGSGNTIQFVQYQDLAIVSDPLTEGVAPAGKKLQNNKITATVDQLGDFVELTDLANLTPTHSTMEETYKLLGMQSAKSLDNQIYSTVKAGTAVRYAGGAASRTALTAQSKIKWSDIRKEVARLRQSGASEFTSVSTRDEKGKIATKKGDGNFVLVVSPAVEQDLMDDPAFERAANSYAAKDKKHELYTGTIVDFAGVTVVRSNCITPVKGGSGSSLNVHISLLFGMDAYANTDLQKLKVYKQGPGGVEDPLEQRMTIGWKAAAKSCILNNNWMARIESVSEY